jgi:hypothetical protein
MISYQSIEASEVKSVTPPWHYQLSSLMDGIIIYILFVSTAVPTTIRATIFDEEASKSRKYFVGTKSSISRSHFLE